MQILVGLGNPGSRYAGNRHNIGFMVLDAIAREHRAAPWRRRFQSEASEAVIGGGDAGHNGLRSITAHLGSGYRRVRLGIGHPGDKNLVHPYVLSDFFKEEWPWVKDLTEACAQFVPLLLQGEEAGFSNKIHLAMQAKGWGQAAPQDG